MIQTAAIAAPTPLATDVTAGALTLRVDQAITTDGNATVASTNAQNDAAPDGLSYVLAQVTVVNNGQRPVPISTADFPFTGSDGVLRRCPSIALPDPPLDIALAPGESATGWTAGPVNDPASVVMLFDPAISQGARFSATFALTGGATLPTFDAPGEVNDLGVDLAAPAALGDTVSTGSWDVTVTEAIGGQAYYEISDYRVQALGAPGNDGWGDLGAALGLSVTIRNRTAQPRFLSWTALELVDTDGEPWDHLLAMTQPTPPASVELLPGATWTGWYGILVLPWATTSLLRFRASRLDDDPRYVSLDGTAGASSEPDESSEPTSAQAEALGVVPGDLVEVTEDVVNVRADASGSAEIVTEVNLGDRLAITGDPIEADGYRWYPIEVVEDGVSGFIVQDFIAPVSE